ncbi:hypothetical protein G9F31_07695 [Acinetobacter sp. 187]|uniref:Uncharacterized protein n=1 Tax=Acinetobacter lanii TaxID=2715163 RepID=A0A6G8S6Q9_9GAMM|nr:hypothetical protein [Acinetobacter lanii]NHC03654.1 hypothetical protein [Acinetobacter lanii]QIO09832.1 hypothetical protein G8D99_12980 [Acinetobacter lanii]
MKATQRYILDKAESLLIELASEIDLGTEEIQDKTQIIAGLATNAVEKQYLIELLKSREEDIDEHTKLYKEILDVLSRSLLKI